MVFGVTYWLVHSYARPFKSLLLDILGFQQWMSEYLPSRAAWWRWGWGWGWAGAGSDGEWLREVRDVLDQCLLGKQRKGTRRGWEVEGKKRLRSGWRNESPPRERIVWENPPWVPSISSSFPVSSKFHSGCWRTCHLSLHVYILTEEQSSHVCISCINFPEKNILGEVLCL